jgi:hypothetical protein
MFYELVVSQTYIIVFRDNVFVCGTEFMSLISFIKFGCSVFVAVSGHVGLHRAEHKMVTSETGLQTEFNNNQGM